jgi:hypothetical protein
MRRWRALLGLVVVVVVAAAGLLAGAAGASESRTMRRIAEEDEATTRTSSSRLVVDPGSAATARPRQEARAADTGAAAAAAEPSLSPPRPTTPSSSSSSASAPTTPNTNDPDPDPPLDLDLARTLASLNTACYCRDLRAVARWRCGRCRDAAPDFKPALVHFDASWDLLGLIGYWPSRRAIVVAFRGTDSGSLYNWAENMRAWRADARYPAPPPSPSPSGGDGPSGPPPPPAPEGMRVHSGFLNLWNSSSMASTFSDAFAALLDANGGFIVGGVGGRSDDANNNNQQNNNNNNTNNQNTPIEAAYVVGHSMGGALAHLCALDLATRFGPEVGSRTHLYTFGAPRVGNEPFARFSRGRVASYWRFTHERDIVPSVPPQLMGFHHAAREVWLVARDSWPGGGWGARDEQLPPPPPPPPPPLPPRSRRRLAEAAEAEVAASAATIPSSSPPSTSLRWPSWPIWPWPPSGPPGPPAPPPPPPPPPGPPPAPSPAKEEERAVLCDPSGEDPSCHDSVCYLGWCTSVADHLLYLGRRFYHVDAECKAPPAVVMMGLEEGDGEGAVVVVVGAGAGGE